MVGVESEDVRGRIVESREDSDARDERAMTEAVEDSVWDMMSEGCFDMG